MYRVIAFLTRKDGLDLAAFRDYYENHHVPLILRLAFAPPIYTRKYLTKDTPILGLQGKVDFDVVTETGFHDEASKRDWISRLSGGEAGKAVRDDEEKFIKREVTRTFLFEERVSSGDDALHLSTNGYRVMAFMTKKDGLDQEAFRDYYEDKHIPLVLGLASVPLLYKRKYLHRDQPIITSNKGMVDFDAIAELVFADEGAFMHDWIGPLGVKAIADDERNFLKREVTRPFEMDEHVSSAM